MDKCFISFFLAAFFLSSCKTFDNKASRVLFDRAILNKDFICESDTSICKEGIVLGTSKFVATIEDIKLNKISGILTANILVIDNNDSVPDVRIIRGRLHNNTIVPLKIIGLTNKKGIARVKFKLLSNEVIYLFHTGYFPIIYKLDDLRQNL